MTIHLSDEQRQALAAGQPVEVVDSDTQLAVIMLAAERYRQRIQEVTTAEVQPQPVLSQTVRPLPPVPCRLRDLPTPPEVAEYTKKHCAGMWFGRKKEQQRVEEELKLQFYFGGVYVGYLKTPEGRVVVAAGPSDGEEVWRQLEALPQGVRLRVIRMVPPIWDDDVSELGMSFAHED